MDDGAVLQRGEQLAEMIRRSDLTIYDGLGGYPGLYFSTPVLEALLDSRLRGLNLAFPPRTRAVRAKAAVAEAMGYPIPKSFRKTQPRFPSQNVDVYVQKADNLQIWNESVDPQRRYVLVRPDAHGIVVSVKVVTGEVVAAWDRTGTLTSKYQARRRPESRGSLLVASADTRRMQMLVGETTAALATMRSASSADLPSVGSVIPIAGLFELLDRLVGVEVLDPGCDQDRARGERLQRVVSEALGIGEYVNASQWPDLQVQALELKLQASPTIDLGLVLPSSEAPVATLEHGLRHSDIRYAVFYASPASAERLRLDAVVVTTGAAFFQEFVQFAGLEVNRKLQIPLPRGFFQSE